MGMKLIGIDNDKETDKKKIIVFVECNRCPADAIMVSTGCRIGKRTYYFYDIGRIAATFLNIETGRAVRVSRKKHVHPEKDASDEEMIKFYDELDEEEFLESREVIVTLGEGDYPGPTVEVIVCDSCGEEVTDKRQVISEGRCLCRSCAGNSYYKELRQR